MWLFEADAVIVSEFFAGADVARGFDDDAIRTRIAVIVFYDGRRAIRCTTVVDPARHAAAHVAIDHVALVEREQERVAGVGGAIVKSIRLRMSQQASAIFHDFRARLDGDLGEHTVAVDRRTASNNFFGHGMTTPAARNANTKFARLRCSCEGKRGSLRAMLIHCWRICSAALADAEHPAQTGRKPDRTQSMSIESTTISSRTSHPADWRWTVLAIAFAFLFGLAGCSAEPGTNLPVAVATPATDTATTPPSVVAATLPGDFDYWLIALSWSPTWCEFNPDNREQCGTRGFGFVLHGLWPQNDRGGGPQNCGSRQRVSERSIDRSLAFMPSRGLIIHEWRSHGSCTTLEPDAYFQLADRAFAAVRIPESLRAPKSPPQLSARDIVGAFREANPGLSSDAIQVMCTGARLSEVRVCANADLTTRSCGKLSRSRCPAGVLRIPSVR